MKSIFTSRQFIFLATIGVGVLGIWASVSAEPQTPPKFTKVENPGEFKLEGKGEPSVLNQKEKLPGEERAIIGSDDRIPMTSRDYPWSAIGKIEGIGADGGGYSCTGTLIAEDVVLTNAHCVVNPETRKVSQAIAFEPNLVNGVVKSKNDIAYATNVHYGTDFKNSTLADYANDWAILKLNKPIGQKYGYLGWKSLPSSTLVGDTKKFSLVGYSGDFPNPKKKGYETLTAGESMTAGVHLGCSILRHQSGLLYHNCDTNHGASGGAIISNINGKYYILALHSGSNEVNGLVLNRAVEMSRLDEWLQGN
ncbi:MAG: trypsin-like serine protease [Nostoc sp. NMS1]|uniref:trypsin-like serine peptidase n=1 Tax=unclassified Nostoc TaxID=2593658 RepID=UPI0025DE37A0|nr:MULTISPECIES: trypsin-like serine protease [unclassified Nostoc]MBN3905925.1 trypsin-like serine protease [Nostoc sp. NMS1]MBN3993145.1 trypsin-like serine protease [Nostoc sp. NMS2]